MFRYMVISIKCKSALNMLKSINFNKIGWRYNMAGLVIKYKGNNIVETDEAITKVLKSSGKVTILIIH